MLLWFSLRKVRLAEVVEVIKSGNYYMVLPVLVISVVVYLLRIHRWSLLFRTLNVKTHSGHLFASLAVCYLVNFVVPRLGEVVRCLVVKRTDKAPFNITLSTIVFERTVDALCLFLVAAIALVEVYFDAHSPLKGYVSMDDVMGRNTAWLVLAAVILLLVLFFAVRRFNNRLSEWMREFFESLLRLLKMRNGFLFVIDTIGIWICYYLMTYLWFHTFKESSGLGFYQAYQVMVVGTFARSLPIQAGAAGAYHFAVAGVLHLMGVSLVTGNALAVIIHGFQTILTVVLGFSSYLWLVAKYRQLTFHEKN